jgi:hypothetical protein
MGAQAIPWQCDPAGEMPGIAAALLRSGDLIVASFLTHGKEMMHGFKSGGGEIG